jgi:hypothetical protein
MRHDPRPGLLMHEVGSPLRTTPRKSANILTRPRHEVGILRVEAGGQRSTAVGSPVLAQSEMCSAHWLGHEMVGPVAFLDGIRKAAQWQALPNRQTREGVTKRSLQK